MLGSAGVLFFTALLVILTGCVGYVDGDGGGVAVVGPPPPDVFLFGGDYDRGGDVRNWSHRGYESRHGDGHGYDRDHRH